MLKKGSKGQEVTYWQLFLQSRKIVVDVDGVFGADTETGTKLWQKRAGIAVDGRVGSKTLEKARDYGYMQVIGEKPTPEPSPSSLEVFDNLPTWVEKVNASRLAKVAPVLATRVNEFIEEAKKDGVVLLVVQGLRTFAEQDALFAQGRTKPGHIVTNARGGQSLHNYGLAVDLAPYQAGNVNWSDAGFQPFGDWADDTGLEWGGRWKTIIDKPHLQDTEGMNLKQVQQLYREGGLAKVWSMVK